MSDAMLRALRMIESGSPEGRYNQVAGVVRGTARKLGAYGIASDDWPTMASDAGLPGARWQDRRAQDTIAAQTLARLHSKYGDWRLVAIAWKAGERVADAVAADPRLLDNEKLAPLADYASQVMTYAGEDINTMGEGETTAYDPDLGTLVAIGSPVRSSTAGDVLRRRLRAMRNYHRNNALNAAGELGHEESTLSSMAPGSESKPIARIRDAQPKVAHPIEREPDVEPDADVDDLRKSGGGGAGKVQ